MSVEIVDSGADAAWRLLATLEGGTLLLGTAGILVYTAKNRVARKLEKTRAIRSVLVTNTTSTLGREIKRKLELQGCTVSTVASETTSEAASEAEEKVDALVVVGATSKANSLEGISGLISQDVYRNLKLMESLSSRVRRGGCIAWACADDEAGADAVSQAFRGAGEAFDRVLLASLEHVAKTSHCQPVWVGRCEGIELAADRVIASLLSTTSENASILYLRNAVHTVGRYIGKLLKIET